MDLSGSNRAELSFEDITNFFIAGIGSGIVRIRVQHGREPVAGNQPRYLINHVLRVMPSAVGRPGIDAAYAAERSIDIVGAAGHRVSADIFP